MTTLQVFTAGTDTLVDTVTVTPFAETIYATGVARPTLEALAEQYAARGITIEVDQIAGRLDGWTDGTVELFAPDEMVDLREADHTGADLKVYWTAPGEKGAAKIRWGSAGDYMRCVRHLSKHVEDAKGLCNVYHVAATGSPPGKGH